MVPGLRRWLAPSTAVQPPRLATVMRSARTGEAARIHWPRTMAHKGPGSLTRVHLQWERAPNEPPALHLIALDNSGSMRQGARLAQAKAFAVRLLDEATRSGSYVAVLLFGGQGVQWLQTAAPARRSVMAPVSRLGGGGGTPLAEGLSQAQVELQTFGRRHSGASRTFWLLTDGRSLEQPSVPQAADQVVIVDFDDPMRPLGRCRHWAERWGAEWRRPLVTES